MYVPNIQAKCIWTLAVWKVELIFPLRNLKEGVSELQERNSLRQRNRKSRVHNTHQSAKKEPNSSSQSLRSEIMI